MGGALSVILPYPLTVRSNCKVNLVVRKLTISHEINYEINLPK
jgi:hypothetical protein